MLRYLDIDAVIVDGVFLFAFRPCLELRLAKGPELGPSHCATTDTIDPATQVYFQVRQSDEGCRFFCNIATYRITSGSPFNNDGLLWLTLSQIQHLLRRGFFNNEARSGLSLLMIHRR